MRKIQATIVGAVALATVIGSAGLAAASGSPAASGTEHFSLMTTSPSGNRYVVIASGVFTAGGVDVSISGTTDKISLPGGGFKVHHGGKLTIIKQSVNPKTCLGTFEAMQHFTISGGTGRYKGISGSGKALITELAIFVRTKGKCNPNRKPLANQQTIRTTRHVKL
jgi:hypothetical protein